MDPRTPSGNFWRSLKQPILALAPMEGYTDCAFRMMARECGADLVYTEFVSSDAIAHRAPTAFKKMAFDPREQPVLCQIFGKDPDAFVAAAREVQARGFAGIDINLGCPAHKVVRSGTGVALMRNPEYVKKLVAATIDAVTIPVSLKMRASIRKERKEIAPGTPERTTALDLMEALEGMPIAAVMVHGRSYEDGFEGPVDISMIRAVKERFKGIVLANGGVTTPERAKELMDATGADGVGIARGALGQPWIFDQIRSYLARGRYDTPSIAQLRSIILRHAELAESTKGPHGIIELRKHCASYIRGYPNASMLRSRLVRVTTRQEIADILDELTDET